MTFLASSGRRALLVLYASLTACSAKQTAHPLDTAILFPLPEPAADAAALRVDSAGEKGVLLPKYASDELPALSSKRNADLLPLLRVVALNIDPCFPSGVFGKTDGDGTSLCRKQIRLIAQPVHEYLPAGAHRDCSCVMS